VSAPPALISPAQLRSRLGDVTLLDVRWQLGRSDGREQFGVGHLPTAAYVDLEADLADPPADPVDDGGRHPLPDPARFEAAMRRCGVSGRRPVVVYDDWGGMAAARAWWLLRFHGHPAVALLDGGYAAWVDAGFETETGERDQPSGDFTVEPGHLPVLDAAAAARVAQRGVLLDARAAERYRGDVEPVDPVAGHVPGARSAPATANLRDGRFRPLSELREIYASTEGAGEVGAYCGSGVNAAHTLFALHLLGRDAALFSGSWSGWTADPTRPVATGEGAP
jgi:thiosulfate/3-mercaptopyruvate sulfurtransferase